MTTGVDLLGASRFVLPRALAESCVAEMVEHGSRGAELFIALAATLDADGLVVHFRRGVIPRQMAHTTSHGLLVTIDGDALFELNRDCYEHGDILAGQIHAHPDAAYHSDTDDALALVQLPGGISVVVPSFGRGGLASVATWSVHQLDRSGKWSPLRDGVELSIA